MNRPLLSASLLALCLLGGQPARAQDAPPYRPLPIPLPEKAQVSVEVDAHEDDLVGVVKSLLRGLNLPALMRMMQGFTAPVGITIPDVTATGEPVPAAPGHEGHGGPAATVQAAPNFADLLKNIHQLRMVVFKAEGFTPEQAIRFYEQPFTEQGGRRVLWVNQGETRMLMMSFREPRGFAVVMPTANDVTVIRADGYPDLEGVGSFVTLAAGLAASMRSSMSDIWDTPATTPEPEVIRVPTPSSGRVARPAPKRAPKRSSKKRVRTRRRR